MRSLSSLNGRRVGSGAKFGGTLGTPLRAQLLRSPPPCRSARKPAPFPPAAVSCIAAHNRTGERDATRRAVLDSRHLRIQRTARRALRHSAFPPSEKSAPHEASQHRHHRPRRPWQDDARRPAAPAVGRLPREPARRRAGDGHGRPRARARHHHSRQGDLGRVEGRTHQHRRHAWPCRFRRRGRADFLDGRRRDRARRRGRRADAADQVRGRQGAQDRPQADRLRQQGRQGRRAAERGRQRGLRSHRRARRHRRAARLSHSLRLGQAGLDGRLARGPEAEHGPALRPRAEACRAAEGRRRRLPHARHSARGQSLSRAHHHGARILRLDQDQRARQGARPPRGHDRAGPGVENPRLSRHRALADRGGRGGRHRRRRGPGKVQCRRHPLRASRRSSR